MAYFRKLDPATLARVQEQMNPGPGRRRRPEPQPAESPKAESTWPNETCVQKAAALKGTEHEALARIAARKDSSLIDRYVAAVLIGCTVVSETWTPSDVLVSAQMSFGDDTFTIGSQT